MTRTLLTLLALAAPLAASADAVGPVTLSFGYEYQREDHVALEADGIGIGAAVDLGDYFFAGAGYSVAKTDTFEADDASVGELEFRNVSASLGGFWPVLDWLGISGSAGYTVSETRGYHGFADDPTERRDGPVGSVGLHTSLFPRVDLGVERGYSYIGRQRGWDNAATLSFQIVSDIFLDTTYWVAEDIDGWSVGARALLFAD